jgi:phosphoenolpyruvate carboxykinase (GTP)
MDGEAPAEALDWRGKSWTPASPGKAAHPNARFTAPAAQCPSISPEWENPRGVPISAIVFGSRRSRLAPLVYESRSWQHGTFVGSSMASETTAAAQGPTGVTRRDPMAMLPFCGYHIGDYFGNWLSVGKRLKNPPRIFHVNWFRRDQNADFIWPGFGENIRVLRWIADRAHGRGEAVESPIGYLPAPGAIDLAGLHLPEAARNELFAIDKEGWLREAAEIEEFYGKIGDRLPLSLREELNALRERLKKS